MYCCVLITMARLSEDQDQLLKLCVERGIALRNLIKNAKWEETYTDVFATSASSKNYYKQKIQLYKLHKLKGIWATPTFLNDLFAQLERNDFMQTLYASTRKGAVRKDDRINDDTSVELLVNGGGEEQQPDQTQDLAVNNSGMVHSSKSISKFIKKAKIVKLEIGADQVDGKLDLVSFNRAGRKNDDGRKIHTSLLLAKWISDPEDANKVSSLPFFCCYSVTLLNFCNSFFHSTF